MIWIALATSIAVLFYFLLRPRNRPVEKAPMQRVQTPGSNAPVRVTPAVIAAAPVAPIPPALAAFRAQQPEALEPARRAALLADLARIPRPPRALHQLVSPEFLANASSRELSELVAGEPVIAAKIMATVNSPLYRLSTPVTTIGQAVTFLGLNSVRGICMRYLLEDSFSPKSPELRQLFNELWQA
ncbi:MAG TPA: HDOD domain-containing protein, partial [Burkholderiaceae bacterium]